MLAKTFGNFSGKEKKEKSCDCFSFFENRNKKD